MRRDPATSAPFIACMPTTRPARRTTSSMLAPPPWVRASVDAKNRM